MLYFFNLLKRVLANFWLSYLLMIVLEVSAHVVQLINEDSIVPFNPVRPVILTNKAKAHEERLLFFGIHF